MYLPLNFVINLKLLFKKACFFFLIFFFKTIVLLYISNKGFPSGSAGKESTCDAADPGSIPVLASFPGEGIGHPLQYFWVSLVAQTVKNPPAMWETWVRSPGCKDSLEEGMATHSSILVWRIPRTEEPGMIQAKARGVAKNQTQLSN